MGIASQTYRDASQHRQRDELIVGHLEFVRHILGRMVGSLPYGLDVENLESAGILGLVEASQQFDESRGVPFKSFAYPRIRGAIIDELRRNCPLPQHVLQTLGRVRRACERLEPPITPEDIARETQLSIAQVEECLEAIRLTRPTGWDAAAHVAFATGLDPADDPRASVELSESKQILADCIEQLPEQERIVLTLYHLEDLRLKEVGEVLGLSESRISRVLAKAEFRLKHLVEARNR